ncbi:serine hydrolase domain-containing protein [Kribbella swartbergensis]
MGERQPILAAARKVVATATTDPRYAHTSHLQIVVRGSLVVDEHLRGPLVADVFSVTKSVLATVLGVVAGRGLLPDVDSPVGAILPALRGKPHTWRHLLTMTRGARIEDVDELTALPGGQVARIAGAPQEHEPGSRFGYDDGAAHLLSAAACELLGESVADVTRRELFEPLGITQAEWRCDPDGIPFGYAHLSISADGLARIGRLWLSDGTWHGRQLLAPAYFAEFRRPQSAGGPPEGLPYGFLTWIGGESLLAGGWAGQHLLVVPSAGAVIVTTGFPNFRFGPPPADDLPPDWRPALDLIRAHVLPVL